MKKIVSKKFFAFDCKQIMQNEELLKFFISLFEKRNKLIQIRNVPNVPRIIDIPKAMLSHKNLMIENSYTSIGFWEYDKEIDFLISLDNFATGEQLVEYMNSYKQRKG